MLGRKKFDHLTDEELIEAYRRDQSPAAFDLLYRRHSHKIYGICLDYLKNQHDAEDSYMEIAAELPQKILKYEIGRFESWLFAVVKNFCLNKLEKALKTRTEDLREISDDFFVENPDLEYHDIEARYIEVLSDAINCLKD